MLGAGTNSKDITLLATALNQYQGQYGKAAGQPENFPKPQLQIVLSPNETLTQAVVTLPREMALGKIAAECVCPCPPGIPVLIPGQKITEEVLERTENKQFTVLATPGLT